MSYTEKEIEQMKWEYEEIKVCWVAYTKLQKLVQFEREQKEFFEEM